MKTAVEEEDVLCCPREPKEDQDQLMIKALCGGMYWDLLDPVTCASTDVFVVVLLSITIWSWILPICVGQ